MGAAEVLKGTCIDTDVSVTLQGNREYFLFPAKSNHYYVSRFNNKNAHLGCFPAERFQIVQQAAAPIEEWPEEPAAVIPNLDQDTLYRAQLIWRTQGYKHRELKEYFVQVQNTHCYFWHDQQKKRFCGSFPLHWFTGFTTVTEVTEQLQEVIEEELPLQEDEDGQLSLFGYSSVLESKGKCSNANN